MSDTTEKTERPEHITDYKLGGVPVTLKKKRGRKPKIRNPEYVPLDHKVRICALYCVLGDPKKVVEQALAQGITTTEKQIRQYKTEAWWAEISHQIMVEQNEKLLTGLNSLLESVLTMLEDRVINGDCHYEKETGDLRRVPINGRNLAQIFNSITHQRNLMRGDPTQITAPTTTQQRLISLGEQFVRLSQGKVIEGEATVIEGDSVGEDKGKDNPGDD